MEGFFTKKETGSKSRPNGKTLSCVSCGMYKDCQSPKMQPYGNFQKGIMILGEASGEVEDRRNKPWQGKTGRLLQQTLSKIGVEIFEDCICVNSCACRPIDEKGNNRTPTDYEIDCCRKFVLNVIEKYKPKIIIPLGNSAIYSLIGHRWKKELGGITKWRGWIIPDQDYSAWICPTYHPSYVERIDNKEGQTNGMTTVWMDDLRQAIQMTNEPFLKNIEPEIEIIEDLSLLRYAIIGNVKAKIIPNKIAFDYETTGLKPHAIGHKIICASVADNANHAYVFMMPKRKRNRQPFIDIISNPYTLKYAANCKFEHTWSKIILGVDVKGWAWDTMLAAHIIDNRTGVTGLKFQTYVNFGIIDYASEISPYLEGDKKNANSFNSIEKLLGLPGGEEKLLKYCAYDSIYEFRLAEKQQSMILPIF
jgi:uracil-DNA glycosylase